MSTFTIDAKPCHRKPPWYLIRKDGKPFAASMLPWRTAHELMSGNDSLQVESGYRYSHKEVGDTLNRLDEWNRRH